MTLRLTVLGTNTPYPAPDAPCSGYLVNASGTLILLDLGLAVWPELLRHTDPTMLTAIWVSHLHSDHCGDLFAAYQWAANTKGAPRLPIYGPPGWADRIGSALATPDGPQQLHRLFDVREHTVADQHLRDVTMTSTPVHHGVPAYGVRLTHQGASFAYSGDTGPCLQLTQLAAGTDVLLCEAGAIHPGNAYHCTPEDAAQAASASERLVLTHLAPDLTATDASHRGGGVTVASPGDVIHCG